MVLVKHEKVRIIESFNGYTVEELNWQGKWERVHGCREWISFGSEVLDEFKWAVLKHTK